MRAHAYGSVRLLLLLPCVGASRVRGAGDRGRVEELFDPGKGALRLAARPGVHARFQASGDGPRMMARWAPALSPTRDGYGLRMGRIQDAPAMHSFGGESVEGFKLPPLPVIEVRRCADPPSVQWFAREGGLLTSHEFSDGAHWVVPGLLLLGSASSLLGRRVTDDGCLLQAFEVGILEDTNALVEAVDSLDHLVRAGQPIYVHAGSARDEGQAALVCACELALLYELSAEEALARVKLYSSKLRKPPVDLTGIDVEQVQKFLRQVWRW